MTEWMSICRLQSKQCSCPVPIVTSQRADFEICHETKRKITHFQEVTHRKETQISDKHALVIVWSIVWKMRPSKKEWMDKFAAPPQVLETPWQWWHIRNASVLPRGWACLRKTWPLWRSRKLWKRWETERSTCHMTPAIQSFTTDHYSFQTDLFAANFWQMKPPGIWVTMYPQKKEPWIIPTVSGSQSNWAFWKEAKICKNENTLKPELGPSKSITSKDRVSPWLLTTTTCLLSL